MAGAESPVLKEGAMGAPQVRTNAAEPGRAIFVVATNNTAVHVYRDVQSLVDAKGAEASRLDLIDFFDVNGVRLLPVLDNNGKLTGLRQAGDRPDPAKVQTRLRIVVRHLASTVDARVANAVPPITRQEALNRLPNLDGRNLAQCYVLLEPVFSHIYGEGGPGPEHNGSWWHNLWAH
jgi:hypothetical protein